MLSTFVVGRLVFVLFNLHRRPDTFKPFASIDKMWTCTLALGLLLASQATAGVVRDGTVVLRRTVGDLGTKEGGDAANIESLDRRQATASTMQNYTSPSWNQDTEAACTAALESMNGAPENPSGLAACYNIPELDMSTGVFQGDVRLYAMGPPTGDFANLAGNPVNVSMQYNGAIVHNQTSTLAKRDDGTSLISWPRDAMWSRATVNEMATYNVKGVVNSDLLANMNRYVWSSQTRSIANKRQYLGRAIPRTDSRPHWYVCQWHHVQHNPILQERQLRKRRLLDN